MTTNNPAPTLTRFLLAATRDAVLVADSDGLLTDVNPAAAALLELLPSAAIGAPVAQVFSHNPGLLSLFLQTGEVTREVKLSRRRIAQGRASTLADGCRVVLLQDTTDQHGIENRRATLAHTLVHDLRNPIAALRGYADLIARQGNLNDTQTRFMDRLRQTADNLYAVLGPLMDLAWVEAGMPLDQRPVALSRVIQQVVGNLSPLAQEHNLILATSLQEPLPPVLGDRERLAQVVHSLLHNAILYSPQHQSIVVHAWSDQREIFVSVADRGFGVAEDELDLIFNRLYRGRDERVRQLPGGGLGLSFARTIITRHGGEIWANSTPNVGSTFTFVLPVASSTARPTQL